MTARMRTVAIHVTKQDIEKGHRKSPSCCAIALAIGRRMKPAYEPRVFGTLLIKKGEEAVSSDPLPPVATRFISNFDMGRPVRPFNFAARLPVRALKK